MKKITVKHFINTNLRPYLVQKEKYYPVYILITVNRKTTKVKSKSFAEMHTELAFQQFINPLGDLYRHIVDEQKALESMIEAQLEIDNNEFDTVLFSAFYNYTSEYSLLKNSALQLAKSESKMEYKDEMVTQNKLASDKLNGLTFFEWFLPGIQEANAKLLKQKGKKNPNAIKVFNVAILMTFFEAMEHIVKIKNKKYGGLRQHYEAYFNDPAYLALDKLKTIR